MGFGGMGGGLLGQVGRWVLIGVVVLWVIRDPAQAGKAAHALAHAAVAGADAVGTLVSNL